MKPEMKQRLLRAVTWLVRLLVGATFIFSGFVKSIDPWGTVYKFDDYLAALGLDLWPNLVLTASFMLCLFEFLAGVFLVTGSFRRVTPWFTLLFMLVMLPLTLWIAVKDPVDDCGCFGDALILSNWATFWKNVALTAGIVWLLFRNRRTGFIIRPAFQWLGVVASAIYILVIALYGYNIQPMLDFRPFSVGTTLLPENGDTPEYRFIYEKEGVRREFAETDELPDESGGWVFVERREVAPLSDSGSGADEKKISSAEFRLWSGSEDVTEEAIPEEGEALMVLIPDLSAMSAAYIWKLNSLYEWAVAHDVEMLAAVCGTPAQIADWEDLAMASYPVYTADDTQVKMLARGNPALVVIKDGEIAFKGSMTLIDGDRIEGSGDEVYKDVDDFGVDHRRLLENVSLLYVAVMAVVIFISFFPEYTKIFSLRRKRMKPKTENQQPTTNN